MKNSNRSACNILMYIAMTLTLCLTESCDLKQTGRYMYYMGRVETSCCMTMLRFLRLFTLLTETDTYKLYNFI